MRHATYLTYYVAVISITKGLSDKEIMESFFGAAAAAPKPFHASVAQQGKSIYERFLSDLCPKKGKPSYPAIGTNRIIK